MFVRIDNYLLPQDEQGQSCHGGWCNRQDYTLCNDDNEVPYCCHVSAA